LARARALAHKLKVLLYVAQREAVVKWRAVQHAGDQALALGRSLAKFDSPASFASTNATMSTSVASRNYQSMAATATNADVDNELGNALSMRIRELHAANTIATATSSLVALHALMASSSKATQLGLELGVLDLLGQIFAKFDAAVTQDGAQNMRI